jgi:hypothetical protein
VTEPVPTAPQPERFDQLAIRLGIGPKRLAAYLAGTSHPVGWIARELDAWIATGGSYDVPQEGGQS